MAERSLIFPAAEYRAQVARVQRRMAEDRFEALLLTTPAIGADLMGRSWVTDIRTWNAPDPEGDGIGLLARALCAPTAASCCPPAHPPSCRRSADEQVPLPPLGPPACRRRG